MAVKKAKKAYQNKPQSDSYSKQRDKQEVAKPAGYRYTDAGAKALKVSLTAKPTAEHITKYAGKTIRGKRYLYIERRADKSDITPSKKLAKGGPVKKKAQAPPQSESYSEERDKKEVAKPVGYRYSDAGAKALKVSPTAKPTPEHIEKYKNRKIRGVNYLYKENRIDKSDKSPKKKFKEGGDVAELQDKVIAEESTIVQLQDEVYKEGGEVEHSSIHDAHIFAEKRIPFKASNLEGKKLTGNDYGVFSFGFFPLWYWSDAKQKWFGNSEHISVSSLKHGSYSKPAHDATLLSTHDLIVEMAEPLKAVEKYDLGGMIMRTIPVATDNTLLAHGTSEQVVL